MGLFVFVELDSLTLKQTKFSALKCLPLNDTLIFKTTIHFALNFHVGPVLKGVRVVVRKRGGNLPQFRGLTATKCPPEIKEGQPVEWYKWIKRLRWFIKTDYKAIGVSEWEDKPYDGINPLFFLLMDELLFHVALSPLNWLVMNTQIETLAYNRVESEWDLKSRKRRGKETTEKDSRITQSMNQQKKNSFSYIMSMKHVFCTTLNTNKTSERICQ